MSDEAKTWPNPKDGQFLPLRRPITEDWLRDNGFRIVTGRNDERFPVRSLTVGGDLPRMPFHSSDDLCIDVAPVDGTQKEWFVWIAQREPWRHIHVRHMTETHEIARLYEGLTGRVWPGTI